METTMMHRFGRILAVTAMALVLGLTLAHGAPVSAQKAHGSIGERTQAQRDLCEVGGGELDVVNRYGSYTNGHQLIKSVTTCKGGASDGNTCTNTKSDTTCEQALVQSTDTSLHGDIIDGGNLAAGDQTTPTPRAAVNGNTALVNSDSQP